jgi:transcriptional regulator with XRE-family HTH domain
MQNTIERRDYMKQNGTGIGERLSELRKERGATLDDVITEINKNYETKLTRANLSRWERGENEPSLRLAKYLCLFYGVSLDYMIGLTDEKEGIYNER